MSLRRPTSGSFGSSVDELLPLLAVQPHQLLAARYPHTPLADLAHLADWPMSDSDTVGRPIRLWGRDPSIARRLNEALAGEQRPSGQPLG